MAIVVLREWHIYYDKQCVDWKISVCPGLALAQTKWTSKSSSEAYLFWKAAQAVAGKHIVIMQWFSPEDWLPNWWNLHPLQKKNEERRNVHNWMTKDDRLMLIS